MIRRLLRRFGYYKVETGYCCGRHWMELDGKMIVQASGDVWAPDEWIRKIGAVITPEWKEWWEEAGDQERAAKTDRRGS